MFLVPKSGLYSVHVRSDVTQERRSVRCVPGCLDALVSYSGSSILPVSLLVLLPVIMLSRGDMRAPKSGQPM